MIEAIFGMIISSFLGIIWMEITGLRVQVNKIENLVLTHEHLDRRRSTDIDSYLK